MSGIDGTTAIAVCGETDLEVASNIARVLLPFNGTITAVAASVLAAPNSGDVTFDINLNGTTIFTNQATRPVVPDGETVSTITTPQIVNFSTGDVLTVDCDTIGAAEGNPGLGFYIIISHQGRSTAVGLDEGETIVVS